MRALRAIALLPVRDYLAAVQALSGTFTAGRLLVLVISVVVCWWVYVPVHELGHVLGCTLTGGEVERLEIAPLYGGALFAKLLPFVVSGSAYAGRLSGFDTRGSDFTYLATDFLPYLLTVFLGVPLLRLAGEPRRRPLAGWAALGAAIPLAFVPFASITGDYYEMGSVLVSRAASWWLPVFDVERWRSDDLFRLAAELRAAGAGAGDWAGVLAALLLGALLACATSWAGSVWARAVLRSHLP